MTKYDATAYYTAEFKAWQKQAGSKPTAEMLEAVHGLGLRPGKQAIACAMALRDAGATNSQIVIVCGAPQLNRMRGLIDDKLVKRLPMSRDERNHTVYKLELTPKGEARIASSRKRAAENEAAGDVVKAADKPAAKVAKGKAKPVKSTGKAKKAAEGTVEHDSTALLPAVELTAPMLAVDDNGQVIALPETDAE